MNNVHSNCCYATAEENQEAPLVYSRQVWSLAVWSGLRDACTVWNSAGNLAWRSLTKLIKRVWVSDNLEMHKCIRLIRDAFLRKSLKLMTKFLNFHYFQATNCLSKTYVYIISKYFRLNDLV